MTADPKSTGADPTAPANTALPGGEPAHAADDFDRLAAYLHGLGLPLDPTRPPHRFPAGLANINILIHAGGRPLVLRRPPPGDLPPGAHDMAREHRVLSRLGKAFPLAPTSLHLCADTTILGVPFQLIEYRPGIVIKGDDTSRLHGHPGRCAALGETMVATLAALHAVDPGAVGLDSLGKPDGFAARQVAGWRDRGQRIVEGEDATAIGSIAGWLEARPPAPRAPRLLHGDFKLDNMILDAATLTPTAVVDWDMATRGDPLFDLATLLSYWTEPRDPPVMHRMAQMPTAAPGFPTRAEVAARYARLTGLDLDDLPFFRVLAMLKLAVVFFQLNLLYRKGQTADPRYAAFDMLARDLLAFTNDIAAGRAA